MPIEVELPDGTIVEFPEGTKPKTMEMALAKYRTRADFSDVQTGASSVKAKRRPATYNMSGIPGVDTQVMGLLDGLQHHALNLPVGLGQLAQHGLNAGANAILPAPEQTMSGLVRGEAP
ncbi:hypothetical protein ACFQZQ_02835 [Lysobacter koreensis]|uniref:Phage tail assembly protein n=1 Tax=Lysobacter koreensis TaxID=266122 RepID=A0ABW2YIH9_9GAMM